MKDITLINFYLMADVDITKKKLVEFCDLLTFYFNEYYQTNEYSFELNSSIGGEIILKNLTGSYRIIRLGIAEFPLNEKNLMNNWKYNSDVILSQYLKIITIFKSSIKSYEWTKSELNIFNDCFNFIGLRKCQKFINIQKNNNRYNFKIISEFI